MHHSQEAQDAVELLMEMGLHVAGLPERKQWIVDGPFKQRFLNEVQLIAWAKDKLDEYHPTDRGPRCPNCKNSVYKFDVNWNGVCSCSFCYHFDHQERFNDGLIIEV